MSTPARWILAILIALIGLGLAAFALSGGIFATVACVQTPPDWVYFVLLVAAVIVLLSALAAAIMIIRRLRAIRILGAMILGALLSCGGLGAYFALLGEFC